MSTYDLEEQEQLATLKAWWKEHGGGVALAAILVASAVAAWNGWVWYQRSQAAQAAALYDTLQKAARANDLKATQETAGSILENYPRSAYAQLAALVSAKVLFQAGDLKTARAQLQWVIEHAKSDEIRSIAALRLASVLVDDKDPDAALKALCNTRLKSLRTISLASQKSMRRSAKLPRPLCGKWSARARSTKR